MPFSSRIGSAAGRRRAVRALADDLGADLVARSCVVITFSSAAGTQHVHVERQQLVLR